LVGRLGADWYVRASGDALFEVAKPLTTMGIGVDSLPESIRLSSILTGNDLGQLGNVERIPTQEEAQLYLDSSDWKSLANEMGLNIHSNQGNHEIAKSLLNRGLVSAAWNWLVAK
jgi:hypothetical protein